MENQDHNEVQKKDESKPVGYGSSIQTDGYGNRNRPPHESDVNPTTQQDHIQEIKDTKATQPIPNTNGTGSNNSVPTTDSVIIDKDQKNKE